LKAENLAETRQIIALVLITIIIGVLGLATLAFAPSMAEDDVVVEDYEATFYMNGTLVEDYVYDVKVSNKYRMLYRLWKAPLSIERLNGPSIEFVSASSSEDMVLYLKDYRGSPWIEDRFKDDSRIIDTVDSLAYSNEVGFFKLDRLEAGKYYLHYVFKVHPPIEYDEDQCHLNLKLADEHIAYRNVGIVVKNAEYVFRIFPHPISLEKTEQEDEILFRGSIGEDELLELEMLLSRDVLGLIDGFPSSYDDVSGPTFRANFLYSIQYYLASTLRGLTRIFAICSPLFIALLYMAYGMEKHFIVPKYLSTLPNKKIKPWVVNLVFKRDALDYDEDGFYATLLDLHKRGKIEIKTKKKGLAIKIKNRRGIDDYEHRVMDFLTEISKKGVVDTDETKKLAKELSSKAIYEPRLRQLKNDLSYVTKSADRQVAKNYMVSGRMKLLPFILVSITLLVVSFLLFFIMPNVGSILSTAIFTSIIPIAQFW